MLADTSSTFDKPPGYRSYLLRFWEERSEQPAAAVWRFSLEDPHTAQRHSFANLETLVIWLKVEMAAQASLNRSQPKGGDSRLPLDSLDNAHSYQPPTNSLNPDSTEETP